MLLHTNLKLLHHILFVQLSVNADQVAPHILAEASGVQLAYKVTVFGSFMIIINIIAIVIVCILPTWKE